MVFSTELQGDDIELTIPLEALLIPGSREPQRLQFVMYRNGKLFQVIENFFYHACSRTTKKNT